MAVSGSSTKPFCSSQLPASCKSAPSQAVDKEALHRFCLVTCDFALKGSNFEGGDIRGNLNWLRRILRRQEFKIEGFQSDIFSESLVLDLKDLPQKIKDLSDDKSVVFPCSLGGGSS